MANGIVFIQRYSMRLSSFILTLSDAELGHWKTVE